jgi:hypothetical protein
LSIEQDGLTYYKYQMIQLANHGEPTTEDPWSELNDSWYGIDGFDYNNLATDAFVIGFDRNGIVQTVESQALRTVMVRSA